MVTSSSAESSCSSAGIQKQTICIATLAEGHGGEFIKCCSAIIYLMEKVTDELSAIGFVLSFLGFFVPSLFNIILISLQDANYQVLVVKYPCHPFFVQGPMRNASQVSFSEILAIFGQLVLVAFKKFSPARFTAHSEALASCVGLQQIRQTLTQTNMELITNTLESFTELKRHIIKRLYSLKYDQVDKNELQRSVANYVLKVLSWNDMSGYRLVVESLVLSKSKILFHSLLYHEVERLLVAVVAVSESQYPPFFKLFAERKAVGLTETNCFRTLFAISLAIKRRKDRSVGRMIDGVRDVSTDLVNTMVILHELELAPILRLVGSEDGEAGHHSLHGSFNQTELVAQFDLRTLNEDFDEDKVMNSHSDL